MARNKVHPKRDALAATLTEQGWERDSIDTWTAFASEVVDGRRATVLLSSVDAKVRLVVGTLAPDGEVYAEDSWEASFDGAAPDTAVVALAAFALGARVTA